MSKISKLEKSEVTSEQKLSLDQVTSQLKKIENIKRNFNISADKLISIESRIANLPKSLLANILKNQIELQNFDQTSKDSADSNPKVNHLDIIPKINPSNYQKKIAKSHIKKSIKKINKKSNHVLTKTKETLGSNSIAKYCKLKKSKKMLIASERSKEGMKNYEINE